MLAQTAFQSFPVRVRVYQSIVGDFNLAEPLRGIGESIW